MKFDLPLMKCVFYFSNTAQNQIEPLNHLFQRLKKYLIKNFIIHHQNISCSTTEKMESKDKTY